jgi:hypothetical protein
MFKKTLSLAIFCVVALYLLYNLCMLIGLPLYPYGMLFFILPFLGLIPLYQFLEFKQISGYKKHLIDHAHFSEDQLASITSQEIETAWRDSLNGTQK